MPILLPAFLSALSSASSALPALSSASSFASSASASAQLADQPLLIVACALIVAAFLVAGLLIQREHDTRERIASLVNGERQAAELRSARALPVPVLSAVDGGAPLPNVIPVLPVNAVEYPAAPTASATPSVPPIPDEVSTGQIGDIAQQPTVIIPAAEMSAIAAATAAREQVPPQILEALGGRWLLAMPWVLIDDAHH